MNRPSVALVFATTVFFQAEVMAQPRFGVEVSAGQGGGITSYVDNAPYTQDDAVFLSNEIAGNGLNVGLTFVFDDLELSLNGQLFDRSRVSLHHVANEPGPLPEDRIRPDGTIDDSGFTYREISATTVTVADRSRGDLLMSSISGGWRYFLIDGDVDIWVPLSGGITAAHILEDTRPWVFGVTASTGLGLTFEIAPPISIFAHSRIHGVLTPSYGAQQDAARTSASVGESTLEAATAGMLFTSFGIGLQVAIR